MNILQINAPTIVKLLLLSGILGAILGVWIYFQPWYEISIGSGYNDTDSIIGTGANTDFGFIAIASLVIYTILLVLRSPYSLLFAFIFFVYYLESFFGQVLLKYMPLNTTELTPQLYLGLPVASFLVLLGAFGTILDKFIPSSILKK